MSSKCRVSHAHVGVNNSDAESSCHEDGVATRSGHKGPVVVRLLVIGVMGIGCCTFAFGKRPSSVSVVSGEKEFISDVSVVAVDKKKCSKMDENCFETKCCSTPGTQCYAKKRQMGNMQGFMCPRP